jgi:hypothetical protein
VQRLSNACLFGAGTTATASPEAGRTNVFCLRVAMDFAEKEKKFLLSNRTRPTILMIRYFLMTHSMTLSSFLFFWSMLSEPSTD